MTPPDATLTAEEARKELYAVMHRDLEFLAKARRALEIGTAYLGVENGHIARIETATNYWESIESTDPPDGEYPAGITLDLGTTYCRRTIQQESPLALHNVPEQGWEHDPAFETHGLHCYHGVPIHVNGDLFGTACFVDSEPRDEPFTEEELMFTELIGHMLGHTLEREYQRVRNAERDRLISVLSRVLRHNLRNDLTVVRGHTEILQEILPPNQLHHTNTIIDTVDDLLAVSEMARQLETVNDHTFDRQALDIEALVREVVSHVADDYPDASFLVEGDDTATVRVSQQLETALHELLDNAAKHTGAEPTVTATVTTTPNAVEIHVADDGPGLPEHEQRVLQQGVETPLSHGSGLGLWHVYWIVKRHDGEISIASSASGTTVTITLPFGETRILSESDHLLTPPSR
ncbi:GAF domain-containing sensor histidine kinase [Natronosalvus vescus]|uniref:sensor histidine kinase n=1 Tax=Natronosalvus vescus TaxID=2953881 RepID=UPI0020900C80|nr:GAF domain-containing sensor histidine kinase [Natronosalvus vescus]